MVISAKTIVETCVIVAVCVDPGVGGQIELELVVTLTASDLKAGKSFAREFLACFRNGYFNAAFQVEIPYLQLKQKISLYHLHSPSHSLSALPLPTVPLSPLLMTLY